MKENILQWHPAFFACLQVELDEEKENLIFEQEHLLGTKPTQIDVLVIKKEKDVPIKKNIGRIFRKYNIIEYKSPTDYLSIDDFYKVYGYACFYKSLGAKENMVAIEDLTVTFVCGKKPHKLLDHLQNKRTYQIEKKEAGIYEICGDVLTMQLIVIQELSDEDNLWLHNLTDDMDNIQVANQLASEYKKHIRDERYAAIMNIIIRANEKKFEEGKNMCEAIRELFAEEFEQQREEAEKAAAQSLVRSVENAMVNFKVNLEKACAGIGTSVEEYNMAKDLLSRQ